MCQAAFFVTVAPGCLAANDLASASEFFSTVKPPGSFTVYLLVLPLFLQLHAMTTALLP